MNIIIFVKNKLKKLRIKFSPIHISNNNIYYSDGRGFMDYMVASGDINGSSRPSGCGCNSGCLTLIAILILLFKLILSIF